MSEQPKEETLLEFPCEFPLKVMGRADGDFAEVVREIAAKHVEGPLNIRQRPSRSGKYTALTLTFTATSKAQLDGLYQALTSDSAVLMAL